MLLDINPDFQRALDFLENSNRHVFITGRAGTGKSTLLQHFRASTAKKIVVLAPTGLAAIQVRGQTIHSFFGFPPHPINSDHIRKRKNRKLYEEMDTLVIDEISMVRADVLDAIDYFMRINGRNRSLPFGGVQMVFIGDLFQLPPVISSDVEKQLFNFLYDTPYFFSSHALHSADITYIELKQIYRQTDRHFLNVLEAIRTKEIEEYLLRDLNERCHKPNFKPTAEQPYITLTATNYTADNINRRELAQLTTPAFSYKGDTTGEFNRQKHTLPNDEIVTLKEGAQVMFVRNDQWYRWVNGTIGRVHYLDSNTVCVAVESDKGEVVHKIEQITWEIVRYNYNETARKIETEIIGAFNQLPLKLAWAITIHKSQGQTFNRTIIDMGQGAFAPGQAYVAFSRCTTMEGIVLRRPLHYSDIIIDERIVQFSRATGIYR
jgi:ATP-dependent DNA helicase PIF1